MNVTVTLTSSVTCCQNVCCYFPFYQKEFQGKILTVEEEHLLLQRLTSAVNLLTLHPAQRLLILQWVKAYLQVLMSLLALGQGMLTGIMELDQLIFTGSVLSAVTKLHSYQANSLFWANALQAFALLLMWLLLFLPFRAVTVIICMNLLQFCVICVFLCHYPWGLGLTCAVILVCYFPIFMPLSMRSSVIKRWTLDLKCAMILVCYWHISMPLSMRSSVTDHGHWVLNVQWS